MKMKEERKRAAAPAIFLPEKLARVVAKQSSLYREVVAEREEIMRHKWLLSERAGYDVGISRATLDWITNHRTAWRREWRRKNSALFFGGL